MRKAGCEGKPVVFLFSDNHIKYESFTEDICMLLNSGEVPNLFETDEKEKILEKMHRQATIEVSH